MQMIRLLNGFTERKKALEIILVSRHFNDLDHLLPVAYVLSECKYDHSVKVVLPDDCGVFSESCIRDFAIFGRVEFLKARYAKLKIFLTRIFKLFRIKHDGYRSKLRNAVMKSSGRCLVVLDRVWDTALIDQIRGCGHVIWSLPHGPMTNINRLTDVQHNSLRELQPTPEDYAQFYDQVVVNDRLELEVNRKLFSELGLLYQIQSNIKILGALRFSKFWLEIRPSLIDSKYRDLNFKADERQVITVFLKKSKRNVNVSLIHSMIDMFAQFKQYRFIIKPHSRGMETRKLLKLVSKIENINISEIDSSSLINLSGAVFFHDGTSIIIEALLKNKPVYELSFLCGNTSVYSQRKWVGEIPNKDRLFILLEKGNFLAPHPNSCKEVKSTYLWSNGECSDQQLIENWVSAFSDAEI